MSKYIEYKDLSFHHKALSMLDWNAKMLILNIIEYELDKSAFVADNKYPVRENIVQNPAEYSRILRDRYVEIVTAFNELRKEAYWMLDYPTSNVVDWLSDSFTLNEMSTLLSEVRACVHDVLEFEGVNVDCVSIPNSDLTVVY